MVREVIGEVVINDASTLGLHNPLKINYNNTDTIIPSVSISRYMIFADSPVVIFKREHVMSMLRPRVSLVEYYYSSLDKFTESLDEFVDKQLALAAFKDSSNTNNKSLAYTALLEKIQSNGIIH